MKPQIPDHEMLRVIGRGAYGEIWLARSLTGAWRAVKVVSRANFDSERVFQREFDGMAAFEPISRGHPGFVHVLHVGRDPGNAFFYYIMELADDVTSGRRIDPENYHPRTLRSDLETHGRLPAAECVRLGLSLTETLAELHGHGLTHRDIKPANLIFVNGEPKLADIGLVAASGQRSFVGTEGYVPAEGPGSEQADLYSLGKVLYEIGMGRDRLDFPELPAALDDWPDKDVLLKLNPVLLKACAHDPRRRHADAEAMGRELAAIGVRRRKFSLWWIIAPLLLLLAALVLLWPRPAQWHPGKPGSLAVRARPADATVLLGEKLRKCPARFQEVEPGSYRLHVMREGFEPFDEMIQIVAGHEISLPEIVLQRSHGSLQITSQPASAKVVVEGPLEPPVGEKPLRHEGVAPFSLADLPSGSYRLTAQIAGSTMEQTVEVTPGEPVAALLRFTAGSLKITSSPGGASVLHNGVEIGQTPLLIEDLTPGEVEYQLRLKGCKAAVVREQIQAGGQSFAAVHLERERIVEPGKPFTDSLGQRYVPLGAIWVADTETRVADYQAFCKDTGAIYQAPDFASGPDYPVVSVNWNDVTAFCRWLTEKEHAAGQLDADLEYRLPTDAEWSRAAGLPDEGGETPEQRDGKIKDQYPWGAGWPPPAGAGNYAPAKVPAAKDPDGFPWAAPVACFAPNTLGLYDLGGNVWEWCADSYNTSAREWGVLRGGSWGTSKKPEMLTSYRNVIDRSERDVLNGFRRVLAPVAP